MVYFVLKWCRTSLLERAHKSSVFDSLSTKLRAAKPCGEISRSQTRRPPSFVDASTGPPVSVDGFVSGDKQTQRLRSYKRGTRLQLNPHHLKNFPGNDLRDALGREVCRSDCLPTKVVPHPDFKAPDSMQNRTEVDAIYKVMRRWVVFPE